MRSAPGQLTLFELDAGDWPGQTREDPPPSLPTPDLPSTVARSEAAADPDPLALLAGLLGRLAQTPPQPPEPDLRRARNEWLRRLQAAKRSESALVAYRIAIDDLLAWCGDRDRNVFDEATIVDYLAGYQQHAHPAPATYYRRFGLLRRFLRWLSRRSGMPDPFLELEPPPKPQQEADWLTEHEFALLLAAAEHPPRRRAGLAERDRLVLRTLVQTGLRRAELIALDWSDLELDSPRPSLLVRCGKGGKPRRQPLATSLAGELALLRDERHAPTDAPVFCGLEGKRLQPTILAGIIRRAAERAAIEKHITAHTLRHTAATWLRQQTGDARLVAAYLGHADLSTVSRYAHVAEDELHEAAAELARLSVATTTASFTAAGRSEAGESPGARAERFHRDRRTAA
jgi:site-specific recombinase XerD